MRKRTRERKEGKGIGLPASLWKRIDEMADAEDKSRSQVVEDALIAAFFLGHGSRESQEETYNAGANGRRYVDVDLDDLD